MCIQRLIPFALAGAGIIIAAVDLQKTASFADVEGLALSIESGQQLTGERADAFAESSELQEASLRCGDISKAAVSVHLGIVDAHSSKARGKHLMNALLALENALRCNPTDGNMWLR